MTAVIPVEAESGVYIYDEKRQIGSGKAFANEFCARDSVNLKTRQTQRRNLLHSTNVAGYSNTGYPLCFCRGLFALISGILATTSKHLETIAQECDHACARRYEEDVPRLEHLFAAPRIYFPDARDPDGAQSENAV